MFNFIIIHFFKQFKNYFIKNIIQYMNNKHTLHQPNTFICENQFMAVPDNAITVSGVVSHYKPIMNSNKYTSDRNYLILLNTTFYSIFKPHLKVHHHLAHRLSQKPRFGHIPNHGRRQTKQNHQKIGHRQIHDEYIGHRSHCVVRVHSHAHQRISDLQINMFG